FAILNFSFKKNAFIPQLLVAYAPNQNVGIQKLMQAALEKLSISNNQIVDFESCDILRSHASSEQYIASICFYNIDEARNGLPLQLSYAIIMPSELRNYEQAVIGAKWKLPSVLRRQFSWNTEMEDDFCTEYLIEGFVPLQYFISIIYLDTVSEKPKMPKVLLRPLNTFEDSNKRKAGSISLSPILCLLFGFMFPVITLSKIIVEEHENGQNFILKIHNVGSSVQICAWFLNGFTQFLLSFVLITVLLKTNWNGSSNALNNCPPLLVFFFFLSYGFSITGFILFISALIRTAKVVTSVIPIIWILVPLPFLLASEMESITSHPLYIAACIILSNVTLGRGLQILIHFENYPLDLTMNKQLFYSGPDFEYGLPFVLCCFYIQTVIFILLSVIFNCNFMNLFISVFKCMPPLYGNKSDEDDLDGNISESIASENSETRIRADATIQFQNVWKKFKSSFVVRNFTFNVYSGEVVALLGHNASGKTTIMKMACGFTIPTLGEIYISGYNLHKHQRQAFKNTGISMPFINLHSEFNVFDQLVFFCRLRGLKYNEAKTDIKAYIRYLQMEDVEKTLIGQLTPGQKCILKTLCAFAGRTQVVLLDKPLDGVDEAKQTLLCNFLQEQKKNRTILVTTNFPKVASSLGDKIAILSRSRLIFFGTEKRLFEKYKDAYRLIFHVNELCDFTKLQLFLGIYLSSIELESKLGDCIVFMIQYNNLFGLISLLENLPKHKDILNLHSFHIHECSLNALLINLFMLEQPTNIFGATKSYLEPADFEPIANYSSRHLNIMIVIRHRLLTDIRVYFIPALKICLTTLAYTWILCMPYLHDHQQPLKNSVYPFAYPNRAIMFIQQRSKNHPILVAGQEYERQGAIDVGDSDIVEFMHKYISDHNMFSDVNIIAAAKFTEKTVDVFFNTKWINTAPHSLALVMNALAIGFVGPESKIIVEMEPLHFSTIHSLQLHHYLDIINMVFSMTLCISFCFICTFPIIFVTLDENRRLDYTTRIAGIRMSLLAVVSLVYDFFSVMLFLIPLNVAILFFQLDLLMEIHIFLIYVYTFAVIGLYVISINILFSFGLTKMRNGFLKVLMFYAFGILFYVTVHELKPFTGQKNVLLLIMDFHPFYALLDMLMRIATITEIRELCTDDQIYETSIYAEECQKIPDCCDSTKQEFHYIQHLSCIYFMISIVWIFIYMVLSLKHVKHNQGKYFWDNYSDSQHDQNILHIGEPNELDDTWIHEKTRVRTLERHYVQNKVLHVEHMSIFFGPKVVLQNINFMVDRFQIVSILGVNGSGKTVLMKAILGICVPSSGCITRSNRSHLDNIGIRKIIGYSSQESKLFFALSVLEIVLMILRIRRLREEFIVKKEAVYFCKVFDLYNYRFQLVGSCSLGVQKRLSVAIAIMSNADLILLDDPFAYLDVISQHNILHLIQEICKYGHSVIYTCSNTEFSSFALRMAALGGSGLSAIGERRYLQQSFYSAYFVIETRIDINKSTNSKLETSDDIARVSRFQREYDASDSLLNDSTEILRYLKVCDLIEKLFPNSIIKYVRYPRACFWVSSHIYSMSQILQILNANKEKFYLFSISEPSVNSAYLRISPRPVNKSSLQY
ncbi:hypothetical protein KR018_004826, partial [Drosophila ironensis]